MPNSERYNAVFTRPDVMEYILLAIFALGFCSLIFLQPPPSIQRNFGDYAQIIWSAFVVLGSPIALWAQRQPPLNLRQLFSHEWPTPKRTLKWLDIERLGLMMAGTATMLYGVAIFVSGATGQTPTGIKGTLGLAIFACLIGASVLRQWRKLGRVIYAIENPEPWNGEERRGVAREETA